MKISLPVTHKFDCSLLQSWSVWLTWLLTVVIDLRKAIILVFYSIRLYFHHQSHPQLSIIYALVQPLYLEKAMAPHSSTLAWKIPWTEEPGRLQSMGSQRVRHFTFTFHFHALEKEMATHSSVLAWRIPGTGEPGGLVSRGSHRVGHDWSDLAAAAAAASSVNTYSMLLV